LSQDKFNQEEFKFNQKLTKKLNNNTQIKTTNCKKLLKNIKNSSDFLQNLFRFSIFENIFCFYLKIKLIS
jgi:hypothetical protein